MPSTRFDHHEKVQDEITNLRLQEKPVYLQSDKTSTLKDSGWIPRWPTAPCRWIGRRPVPWAVGRGTTESTLHAGSEEGSGGLRRGGWVGLSWMLNCCVYRQVYCDFGATSNMYMLGWKERMAAMPCSRLLSARMWSRKGTHWSTRIAALAKIGEKNTKRFCVNSWNFLNDYEWSTEKKQKKETVCVVAHAKGRSLSKWWVRRWGVLSLYCACYAMMCQWPWTKLSWQDRIFSSARNRQSMCFIQSLNWNASWIPKWLWNVCLPK